MAKQDLQAQLDSKRAELVTVKKDMAAATQAAISAKSELATVTDEQAAIAAVARERVSNNKARVLHEQAAQLETEIAGLLRRQDEERHEAIKAEAQRTLEAARDAAWAFWTALDAAEAADRARLDTESKLSGHPHHGSWLAQETQTLRGVLVRLRVADEVGAPSPGARSELRRKGSQAPAKQTGVKGMVAQLAAAVTG